MSICTCPPVIADVRELCAGCDEAYQLDMAENTPEVREVEDDSYMADLADEDSEYDDEEEYEEEEYDQFESDGAADADALSSAGWGTDEDYGCFGGDDFY